MTKCLASSQVASTEAGSELQKPLAIVIIGGLLTSTILTVLTLPLIYDWFEWEK